MACRSSSSRHRVKAEVCWSVQDCLCEMDGARPVTSWRYLSRSTPDAHDDSQPIRNTRPTGFSY